MGRTLKLTLHYKSKGGQPYDSITTSRSAPKNRGVFTSNLVKTWALNPKNCIRGSCAQRPPNTNIMTRPRVTLSVQRSSRRDLPTLLKLLQGQKCIKRLPVVSPGRIVQRSLYLNFFLVFTPASPAFVRACLQSLLWWKRPHRSMVGHVPLESLLRVALRLLAP